MTKYKVWFSASYLKKSKRFKRRHPDLLNRYKKTLQLLELNPFHPSLRLHRLKGELKDLHSVSINLQYRITLRFVIKDDLIIPVDIGSHDKVY
ncbi:MAG: type II toxin-antitoxin system RelE/ParE family toxin [Candidatus Marinimicrobia bacterium]|nr:type II toxin-antitoxin system RelE/ParE family toxin [Candidatus Neomarinimicrobiota bacterium]